MLISLALLVLLIAAVLLFVRLDNRYGWTDPNTSISDAFVVYRRRDRPQQ